MNRNFQLNATAKDFDKVFDRFLTESPTYRAAYEKTEQLHEEETGHRKYSDSESYRVARSKRIRKRNKRNQNVT